MPNKDTAGSEQPRNKDELNEYLNKLWNGAIGGKKLSTTHVRQLEKLIAAHDAEIKQQAVQEFGERETTVLDICSPCMIKIIGKTKGKREKE